MNKKLKVKLIGETNIVKRPKHQEVLDFANSNDIEIISIIDDRDKFAIFYYEK